METPRCINGNKANIICVSDDCDHPNPFICIQCVNDQCKQLHDTCVTTDWINIKKKIEKSKQINNINFIKISNLVQETITKAFKYLQKQMQSFKEWKQTFGIPTEAVDLFKSIQINEEFRFTGKKVSQILKVAKQEKQIQKFNEAKYKKQMKEILEKMEQTQKFIREMYSTWYRDIKCDFKQSLENSKEKILNIEQPFKNQQIACPQVKYQLSNGQTKPLQLSLKIKQQYSENLTKRLKALKEKPTDLELKFVIIE